MSGSSIQQSNDPDRTSPIPHGLAAKHQAISVLHRYHWNIRRINRVRNGKVRTTQSRLTGMPAINLLQRTCCSKLITQPLLGLLMACNTY
jgi:hypothetical protein